MAKKKAGRATGGKHRTVLDKGEKMYEALRKKRGLSAGTAAAIANAYANGTLKHKGGKKKGK